MYSYRIDTPRIQGSVDIHGRSSGEIRRAGRFTGGRRAVDQVGSSGMCELNFYFRWVCMRDATRHDGGASPSAGFWITLVYFWPAYVARLSEVEISRYPNFHSLRIVYLWAIESNNYCELYDRLKYRHECLGLCIDTVNALEGKKYSDIRYRRLKVESMSGAIDHAD